MNEKELFETYREEVYRTCFFMLRRTADAEDVCQEVFIAVFRHDWRKIEHVRTWLMKIAMTRCINHVKRENRYRYKFERLQRLTAPAESLPVEAVAERNEALGECMNMLAGLPVKIRAVVALRFINECSLQEIAAILAIPTGTVKSRLNKGLKLMKSVMKPGGDEHGCHPNDRTAVRTLAE